VIADICSQRIRRSTFGVAFVVTYTIRWGALAGCGYRYTWGFGMCSSICFKFHESHYPLSFRFGRY